MGVVDRLEAIKVEVEHGEARLHAPRQRHFGAHAFHELAAVEQARQTVVAGQIFHVLLVRMALGHVGEGAQHAAPLHGQAAYFQDAPVGAPAHHQRGDGRTTGRLEMRDGLGRQAVELALRALVANHVLDMGAVLQHLRRQVQQGEDALVAELHPPLGIHHGHALVHGLQRGLQDGRFPLQQGRARARGGLGAGQQGLLALQLGDVQVRVQARTSAVGPCHHAAVARPGQRQLEWSAREAQHLAQGLQALGAGVGIGGVHARPGGVEHLRQGGAHGGLRVAQAVHMGERRVHPGNAPCGVAQHQAVGHTVEQRQGRAAARRQRHGGGLLLLHILVQAPQAQPPDAVDGQRRHQQFATAVREHIRLGLVAMARNARLDVLVDVRHLLGPQPAQVKAAQVMAVVLAHEDMALVLGKVAQECVVPGHRLVLRVEQTHGNPQPIEHVPQGFNPRIRTGVHGVQGSSLHIQALWCRCFL